MKVYVITKGSYSDYGICAVAIDPDRAELLRKYYSRDGWEVARIEEYDTDDVCVSGAPKRIFNFEITKTGAVEDGEEQWSFSDDPFENKFKFLPYDEFRFSAQVMAPDRDHALKIALDQRTKMLAEKLGL